MLPKTLLSKTAFCGCIGLALLPIAAAFAAPSDPPATAPAAAASASAPAPPASASAPAAAAPAAVPVSAAAPAAYALPAARRTFAPPHAVRTATRHIAQPVTHRLAVPRPGVLAARRPVVPVKAIAAVPVQAIAPAPRTAKAFVPAPVRAKAFVPALIAAPARAKTTMAVPAAPRALPDYGGRDGIAGTAYAAQSSPALNPLAQAGRAFEALVIVLALVIGGLYLLKRSGVLGAGDTALPSAAALPGLLKNIKLATPAPAAPTQAPNPAAFGLTVVGSQPLPGVPGASLHLVTVSGKTLLIAATAQSVTLLSEVEAVRPSHAISETLDTGRAPFGFDGFLSRAQLSPQEHSNETEMLLNATTMRLQAMIARSEVQTGNGRS